MTQKADFEQARATITREVVKRVQGMLSELESLDNVFEAIGLKGSVADVNLRTAAIALSVVAAGCRA